MSGADAGVHVGRCVDACDVDEERQVLGESPAARVRCRREPVVSVLRSDRLEQGSVDSRNCQHRRWRQRAVLQGQGVQAASAGTDAIFPAPGVKILREIAIARAVDAS